MCRGPLAVSIVLSACGPNAPSKQDACEGLAAQARQRVAQVLARTVERREARPLIESILQERSRGFDAHQCLEWTQDQIACAQSSDIGSAEFEACLWLDHAADQAKMVRDLVSVAHQWRAGLQLELIASDQPVCVITGRSMTLHAYATPPTPDQIPFGIHLIAGKNAAEACHIDADLRRGPSGEWMCESATVLCGCIPTGGAEGCEQLVSLCSIPTKT